MINQDNYNAAIDKIRDEMAKKASGRYVQVVGEYLTAHLQHNPDAADAILADGKTIAGSLDAMKKEAQKHREGNVAVLDDATAFGIVLGYFGIKGKATAAAGTSCDPASRAAFPEGEGGEPPAPEPVDPFDLDALMGVI